MLHPLLKIGPRVSVLPVVNGSGDFAWEVRRVLMQGKFDCLAVPLPPSFKEQVEKAVLDLPKPSVVIQRSQAYRALWVDENDLDESEQETPWERSGPANHETSRFERSAEDRSDYEQQFESADSGGDEIDSDDIDLLGEEADEEEDEGAWTDEGNVSYVPIDPCQAVIAAIRTAMGEHIPRHFIDLETDNFEPYSILTPDPYSLKQVRIERFAAAMLPSIPRPDSQQRIERITTMAYNLRQLSIDYQNILLVCNVLDWPWIREAYFMPDANPPSNDFVETPNIYDIQPKTLFFLLGELPYITALYESARQTLDDDSRLSIDGIKRLLIAARQHYNRKVGKSARKITPLLLRQCLQYIRNLTLLERRLTPDLFTIVRAVQQVGGDTYAYYVLKTARKYLPSKRLEDLEFESPSDERESDLTDIDLQNLSSEMADWISALVSHTERKAEPSDESESGPNASSEASSDAPGAEGGKSATDSARDAGFSGDPAPAANGADADSRSDNSLNSLSSVDPQEILNRIPDRELELSERELFEDLPLVKIGIGKIEMPDEDVVAAVSRLPGPPVHWSHLELRPKKDFKKDKSKWMKNWNPYMQCSWPPEDERIERFRSAVFDRAKQIVGADAARSEKFTTSVQDGIDIRETLRHWYDGDIYVKIHPPVRGGLDCVVMLFDTPADPKEYKWRATWFAEHKDESTLAFYATNFADSPVGPGICTATYGGTMFLYPPRAIPEVWQDRRFDFATTLEERLIAAACKFAQCRQVALLSPVAPGHNWRRIAKQFGKTLVHVPLGQFSDSTIQQLRIVHVLNGKQVRSYAADFIRRS